MFIYVFCEWGRVTIIPEGTFAFIVPFNKVPAYLSYVHFIAVQAIQFVYPVDKNLSWL